MSVDPRLLRSFVVLAQELHFGRAAKRIDQTQPALSQQIRRLEAQLDVRLFDRGGAGVALTGEGRAALPHAQQAVAATDAVERAAATAALAGRAAAG